jgi:signal peptidase II
LKKAVIIILLVLLLDQALKFFVKTTMYLGESHSIFGNWFFIHFTENEGMAFGMKLGGSFGKLFLSLFRIIADQHHRMVALQDCHTAKRQHAA